MLEIRKAEGRAPGAFFDYALKWGYAPAEKRYIRRYYEPHSQKRAYLTAVKDNKTLACLLTWSEERPAQGGRRRVGFFTLPGGDAKALGDLIGQMLFLQKAWGSEEVIGPLAPDGSGWFMGQCDRPCTVEERGLFTGAGDAGQMKALTDAGFCVEREYRCYQLPVPKTNRTRAYADKIAARFEIHATRLNHNLFTQPLAKAADELYLENSQAMRRAAERIAPFTDSHRSFAVKTAGDKTAGYVLAFAGKRPRVATIMTREGLLRRPATLLLVNALIESYKSSDASIVELSVIDAENAASERLATAFGAKPGRSYFVYNKKLM